MAKKKTTTSEAKNPVKAEGQEAKQGEIVSSKTKYKNYTDKIKAKLKNEPKQRVYIPKEAHEPDGVTEPVIINGVRFNVKKGVYVEVPQTIATLVEQSQQQTAQAFIDAEEKLKNSEKMEFDNS